ncbi:MAG: patatin family protein [Lachnospiraceae bacterium]|nr:patatin family protein [Lachnospiraceae bacterium]
MKKKVGLVLEGGGMRGMYTAGVLDAMLENNIMVDGIVGVSAGSIFGCNYKSRQIGRAIRYNLKYVNDKRYMSLKSLILTGNYFVEDFCYHELPEKLDPFDAKTFKSTPEKFYSVSMDINSGEAVYHELKNGDADDLEWMRASGSLPLVATIVKKDGREMLDGGMVDSIPIKWMQSQGYEKNIVVLTQPEDYVKEKSGIIPLIKLKYRKYPALIDGISNRHIMYNDTIEYIKSEKKKNNVLVIQPDTSLGVGRTEKNTDKLQAAYDRGRSDTVRMLDEIRKYMEE